MCGLYGFTTSPRSKMTQKQKHDLTVALGFKSEPRGEDSFGLLVKSMKNKLSTIKGLGTLKDSDLPKTQVKLIKDAKFMMGHNRMASHGEVTLKNCHPFQLGNWIMSHNGVISGHTRYKKETTMLPVGETDSETLLSWLVSKNKVINDFLKVETYHDAFTVYDTAEDKLYIITKGKELYYIQDSDMLVYSSESIITSSSYEIATGKVRVPEIIPCDRVSELTPSGIQTIEHSPHSSGLIQNNPGWKQAWEYDTDAVKYGYGGR